MKCSPATVGHAIDCTAGMLLGYALPLTDTPPRTVTPRCGRRSLPRHPNRHRHNVTASSGATCTVGPAACWRVVTVALSAESADEIFGGYREFHDPKIQQVDTFPWLVKVDGPMRAERWLPTPALRDALDLQTYRADRYREAVAEVARVPEEEGPIAEGATLITQQQPVESWQAPASATRQPPSHVAAPGSSCRPWQSRQPEIRGLW
jgi:hypothetical protein